MQMEMAAEEQVDGRSTCVSAEGEDSLSKPQQVSTWLSLIQEFITRINCYIRQSLLSLHFLCLGGLLVKLVTIRILLYC